MSRQALPRHSLSWKSTVPVIAEVVSVQPRDGVAPPEWSCSALSSPTAGKSRKATESVDPKVDAHLHESTFQVIDKDTVEQRSTVFANSKATPELKTILHRKASTN